MNAKSLPQVGMRDAAYQDSTPHLHVGDSAFEDWFESQPFATQNDVKQISRDSYAAGMGDPLVTCARSVLSATASLQEAHKLGFVRAAGWAKRDDLCADVDSPAYLNDQQSDLQTFAASHPANILVERDLSMLVRRLAKEIKFLAPGNMLCAAAMEYLERKGLNGSSLRTSETPADMPSSA